MELIGLMEVKVQCAGKDVSVLSVPMGDNDFFFSFGRPRQIDSLSYVLDRVRHSFGSMETSEILQEQYTVDVTPGQELREMLKGSMEYEEIIANIHFSLSLFKGEPHLVGQGNLLIPIPLGKSRMSETLNGTNLIERAAFAAVLDNNFESVSVMDIADVIYCIDPFLRRQEWKVSQDIAHWISKEENRRGGSSWEFTFPYFDLEGIPYQMARLTGNKLLSWNK